MEYLRSGFQSIVSVANYITYLIQNYAWHALFTSLALYYIYNKFVRPALERYYGTYEDYKKRKDEEEYAAQYHKNPDLFSERISAQLAAAQRLQEKYDEEAKVHREKLKEKEERKRQEVERLLNGTNTGGFRLGGNGEDDSMPKSLRPEYNPLMGAGSSTYRPPKKSKCGGGGCGK